MNMYSSAPRFFAKLVFAALASMLAFGAQAKCKIADGPIKYGKCVKAEANAAAERAKDAADKAAAKAKAAAAKAKAAATEAAAEAKNKGDRASADAKAAADKASADAKAAADKAVADAKAAADKAVANVNAAAEDAVNRQVCIDTVTAIDKGKVLAFMDGAKAQAKKEAQVLRAKFKDASKRNQILGQADKMLNDMNKAIPELKRIREIARKSDALAKLFRTPDLICSGDVKKINAYLEHNGLKPNLSLLKAQAAPGAMDWLIPSAHAYNQPGDHFFMGYQASVTLGAGIGGTAAFSYTTDYRDNGALGFSISGGFYDDVTALIGASVTFYPAANAKDFAGNGFVPDVNSTLVIGVGSPKVRIGGNVELPLYSEYNVTHLAGVGISGVFGAGINPLTVDFAANIGWTLWAHNYH